MRGWDAGGALAVAVALGMLLGEARGAGPEGELTSIGLVSGEAIRGSTANGRVQLGLPAGPKILEPPEKACDAELALSRGQVRVRWICGATLEAFGTVHEVRVDPKTGAEVQRTRDDGVPWLRRALGEELSAGRRDEARGLLASFAGRLQYAASPEQRADLMGVWLADTVARADALVQAGDPAGAAALAHDLLQNPPIWEPERPWDYMERLRIGPPAGNRPAPERVMYLPSTPEHVRATRGLVRALEGGGHPAAAAELAQNLARVAP